MLTMILALLHTALASATSPSPDSEAVAFVARIYSKPGSKAKSRGRIYLCGYHGEHRHALAAATGDVYSVTWKDENHLLWLASFPNRDDAHYCVQSEFDLRSHQVQSKRIQGIDDTVWGKSESQFRGEPDKFESTDKAHPALFGYSEDHNSWVYTANGQTKKFHPDELTAHGMTFNPATNALWFLDWTHNSTLGSFYAVYRFDWKLEKPVLAFDGAGAFDFSPNRRIYGAVATRGLAPIDGKRNVWVAKAWTGDWQTGKKWNLADGMVYATSISIRPTKR